MTPVPKVIVDEMLRVAESAAALRLKSPTVIQQGRATVVRASTRGSSTIAAVILKRFHPPYHDHFLRERQGLQLLASIPELKAFTPHLIVAHDTTLMLVTICLDERIPDRDLTGSHDSPTQDAMLMDTAHRLGLLHGHACSRTRDFQVGTAELPSPGSQLLSGIPATLSFLERAWFEEIQPRDFPLDAVGAELTRVAREVDAPSDLRTVTLGDMAPSNILAGPEGPVFIDLEYCGVRHAFYDAMYWHCICPFPSHTVDMMDTAYRDGLRSAGIDLDDESFHRDMVSHLSHRLFWTLSWNMNGLFDEDRDVVPGVSTRRVVREYLRGYSRLAARSDDTQQSPLSRVVTILERRLAELWPD